MDCKLALTSFFTNVFGIGFLESVKFTCPKLNKKKKIPALLPLDLPNARLITFALTLWQQRFALQFVAFRLSLLAFVSQVFVQYTSLP
jgi:hypothetical protein